MYYYFKKKGYVFIQNLIGLKYILLVIFVSINFVFEASINSYISGIMILGLKLT